MQDRVRNELGDHELGVGNDRGREPDEAAQGGDQQKDIEFFAMLIAYILGRSLQQQISRPIQTLGRAALAVSEKRDYSVRAPKLGNDELGALTDAFNHMLDQLTADITERKAFGTRLQRQLSRLDLLQRITRAVGERQDLSSIFQVVIRHLEEDVPVDFGCICLYEPHEEILTVTSVGGEGKSLSQRS